MNNSFFFTTDSDVCLPYLHPLLPGISLLSASSPHPPPSNHPPTHPTPRVCFLSRRNYLLDGLEKIKSRGYDGAGIATMAPAKGDMVSKERVYISIILQLSLNLPNHVFSPLANKHISHNILLTAALSFSSILYSRRQSSRNQASTISSIRSAWCANRHVPSPAIP